MNTVTHLPARLAAFALFLLAALPAAADNINPASTNRPPWKVRPEPKDLACDSCNEKTLVTNACVLFSVRFGRSPLVAESPVGRIEVFEQTAARLPSGADVLRFDHPLLRRIVDRDDAADLVSIEEGSGWIVVYKGGVPAGWSSGADLALRRDPATGLFVELLEDRTQVFYGPDNVPTHLVTPAGVRLDWDNAGLDVVWNGFALGQVWSKADGLMDVEKLSRSSFRVSWYPPSAVGPKDPATGRYAAVGAPAKTFTFAYTKVGAEHRYALRERRDDTFDFRYLWTSRDGLDWTFVKDPDGLAVTDAAVSTFAPGSTAAAGVRHETHTYSDAAGATRRLVRTYRYNVNGATLIGETALDAAGASLPVWSGARHDIGAAVGRLAISTNEYGGATAFTYDGHGRRLTATRTVFGSLEEVTAYAYETNLVDGFPDRRPRHVVTTRGGVVVSDVAYDYAFAPDGGRLDTVTRAAPATGASLVSSRLYYPATSTNAAEAGRIHLSVSEDRTATLYSYTPSPSGGYIRTITNGYIGEPDASAPCADASRFAIVPSQSTRSFETVNVRGDVVRVEKEVHTGEAWSPAGWTTYTYNLAHKRTGFADHKGDYERSEWICTGPVWQDLADGTAVTNTFDKAKRLSTSTHYTPFGAVTTAYSYDAAGQLLGTVISTNGVAVRGTMRAYDARGRLVLSVDEQGRTNTVAYSADNRAVTRTTQAGAVTTTTLHPDGSVATIAGNVRPYETRSYGVDPATGLFWEEVRTAQNETAESVLSSRTYRNALGQTVRVEEPAPNAATRITARTYDALGRLSSEVITASGGAGGSPADGPSAPSGGAGGSPAVIRPVATYAYDSLGDLVRTTQTSTSGVWRAQTSGTSYALAPDGSVWSRDLSLSFCSDPSIDALTNRTDRKLFPLSPSERSHVVSYDLRGNATHEMTSFDRTTARTISTTLEPWSINPASTLYVAGLAVRAVDHSFVTNAFEYDAIGQRIAATDGRGNMTAFVYDSLGLLTSSTDAATNTTSFVYDAAGRTVSVIDALGNATHVAYDAANRRIAEWGATYPAVYAYDSYGRTIALATTRDTNFVLSAESIPDLSNPPDALDVTRWDYDESTGLLLDKRYADGKGPSYDYSPEGLLARRTWARGVTTDYAYDDFDALVSKTYSDETPFVSLGYDTQGRLLSAICDGVSTNVYAYNQYGQVTNELQNGTALARSYDAFGRPTGYRIGDGMAEGSAVSYAYDANGRFSAVSSGTIIFSYSYLPGSSLVSGMTANTGHSWERIYEPNRDLIATVHNRYGDRTISRFDYTNDEIGRRVARVDSGEAFAQTAFERYSYNGRSEVIGSQRFYGSNITDSSRPVPGRAFFYGYDPIGNRTNSVETIDGMLETKTYVANALNQYETIQTEFGNDSNPKAIALEYDDDGNMTFDGRFRYSWNGENRMICAIEADVPANLPATTIDYTYDHQGRMIAKNTSRTNEVICTLLWDEYNIVREAGNNIMSYNIWGLDIDGQLQGYGGIGGLLNVFTDNKSYVLYYDAAGNIVDYVSSNTAESFAFSYSPFAEILVSVEIPFSHRFSTKSTCDEAGLSEYEKRLYSRVLGRWLSRDFIGEDGGLNLFEFVNNSPVQHVDLLGLKCCMTWMMKGPPSKSSHAILACDNGLYISFGPKSGVVKSKNPTKEEDFSSEHYGVIDFNDLLTDSKDGFHQTKKNSAGTIRKFRTVCLDCVDTSKIVPPTNRTNWSLLWNCADEVQNALRAGMSDQEKVKCPTCEKPEDYLKSILLLTPGDLYYRVKAIQINECSRWHCVRRHHTPPIHH